MGLILGPSFRPLGNMRLGAFVGIRQSEKNNNRQRRDCV